MDNRVQPVHQHLWAQLLIHRRRIYHWHTELRKADRPRLRAVENPEWRSGHPRISPASLDSGIVARPCGAGLVRLERAAPSPLDHAQHWRCHLCRWCQIWVAVSLFFLFCLPAWKPRGAHPIDLSGADKFPGVPRSTLSMFTRRMQRQQVPPAPRCGPWPGLRFPSSRRTCMIEWVMGGGTRCLLSSRWFSGFLRP